MSKNSETVFYQDQGIKYYEKDGYAFVEIETDEDLSFFKSYGHVNASAQHSLVNLKRMKDHFGIRRIFLFRYWKELYRYRVFSKAYEKLRKK